MTPLSPRVLLLLEWIDTVQHVGMASTLPVRVIVFGDDSASSCHASELATWTIQSSKAIDTNSLASVR